ncbi:hypothetical protein EXIGLDRAFT_837724 [Exidia glandulosa HHB12029]|uniref:GTP-binding protein n=1 Tax=Exidia glandulosa HHB12029 TaxID=1314781 RepID=A0A165GI94_EXIGL|nr:hypothetical protein EXIGLDRAFT_837724 [Exidia glandulosa HHB12029]
MSSLAHAATAGLNGDAKTPAYSKILLLGQRRSGKTSAKETVFMNLPPKQTFYLESTPRITKTRFESIVPFELWDCPASTSVAALGVPLTEISSLVYFIDVQDTYNVPITKFVALVLDCLRENPDIHFEVLVHKAESIPEEYRIENFRIIQNRLSDELEDVGIDLREVQLNYHLTSVYDHSLWEAFSHIIQRNFGADFLESCLNLFCANSQIQKAFIFDIATRIYLATDSSPVDPADYALAWDYVNTLRQLEPLYSPKGRTGPADAWGTSIVRLNSSTTSIVIAYWQLNTHLAVVAILPAETYRERVALIDYNLVYFREGVQEGCELLASGGDAMRD